MHLLLLATTISVTAHADVIDHGVFADWDAFAENVIGDAPPVTCYTCAGQGWDCGTPGDNCGGTLSCGSCAIPETCGGGGTANVCGCTATTCVAEGYECGTPDDGCGSALSSCGTCTSPDVCSDTTYTCVLSDIDWLANGTGIAHKTDLPSGFAEPHFFWDARQPTLWTGQWCASEPCSLSWTGTASTTTMTLPICTDGSWDDLSSANCLKAMYFDGGSTIGYLTTDDNITWSGTDSSLITLAWEDYDLSSPTGLSVIVATANVAAGTPGFEVEVKNGDCRLDVASNGGAATASAIDGAAGQQDYCGGIIDIGGNLTAFVSTTSGATAAPAAPYTPAAGKIAIGARPDGSSDMRGWISQIIIFDGNTYSSTISQVGRKWRYGDILFGNDRPTNARTGGDLVIATEDGKWHHMHDDWQLMGAAVPVGRTGGGSACIGMATQGIYNGNDWENKLLYNLDMTAGSWTETGSSVISSSTTGSPFADGRAVSRIQDNDGAALESAEQLIVNLGALAGQKAFAQIWAQSTSGTAYLDVRLREEEGIGSGCTNPETNMVPVAVGTTWKEILLDFTKVDNNCFDLEVSLASVSGTGVDGWTDVASTGVDIIVLPQFIFENTDVKPMGIIITEGATATLSSPDFYWNNVAGLDIKPNGTDPYRMRIKMFPFDETFFPDAAHNNVTYAVLSTGATSDSLAIMHNNGDNDLELRWDASTFTEGAQAAWTPGTLATYDALIEIDSDVYTLEENSSEIGADGASTTTAPAVAWDSLWLMYTPTGFTDAEDGPPQGACIQYFGWENVAP